MTASNQHSELVATIRRGHLAAWETYLRPIPAKHPEDCAVCAALDNLVEQHETLNQQFLEIVEEQKYLHEQNENLQRSYELCLEERDTVRYLNRKAEERCAEAFMEARRLKEQNKALLVGAEDREQQYLGLLEQLEAYREALRSARVYIEATRLQPYNYDAVSQAWEALIEAAYPASEPKTPFQKVTDDLTGGCGCVCHTGTGYRTSCEHCYPASSPCDHTWSLPENAGVFRCMKCGVETTDVQALNPASEPKEDE